MSGVSRIDALCVHPKCKRRRQGSLFTILAHMAQHYRQETNKFDHGIGHCLGCKAVFTDYSFVYDHRCRRTCFDFFTYHNDYGRTLRDATLDFHTYFYQNVIIIPDPNAFNAQMDMVDEFQNGQNGRGSVTPRYSPHTPTEAQQHFSSSRRTTPTRYSGGYATSTNLAAYASRSRSITPTRQYTPPAMARGHSTPNRTLPRTVYSVPDQNQTANLTLVNEAAPRRIGYSTTTPARNRVGTPSRNGADALREPPSPAWTSTLPTSVARELWPEREPNLPIPQHQPIVAQQAIQVQAADDRSRKSCLKRPAPTNEEDEFVKRTKESLRRLQTPSRERRDPRLRAVNVEQCRDSRLNDAPIAAKAAEPAAKCDQSLIKEVADIFEAAGLIANLKTSCGSANAPDGVAEKPSVVTFEDTSVSGRYSKENASISSESDESQLQILEEHENLNDVQTDPMCEASGGSKISQKAMTTTSQPSAKKSRWDHTTTRAAAVPVRKSRWNMKGSVAPESQTCIAHSTVSSDAKVVASRPDTKSYLGIDPAAAVIARQPSPTVPSIRLKILEPLRPETECGSRSGAGTGAGRDPRTILGARSNAVPGAERGLKRPPPGTESGPVSGTGVGIGARSGSGSAGSCVTVAADSGPGKKANLCTPAAAVARTCPSAPSTLPEHTEPPPPGIDCGSVSKVGAEPRPGTGTGAGAKSGPETGSRTRPEVGYGAVAGARPGAKSGAESRSGSGSNSVPGAGDKSTSRPDSVRIETTHQTRQPPPPPPPAAGMYWNPNVPPPPQPYHSYYHQTMAAGAPAPPGVEPMTSSYAYGGFYPPADYGQSMYANMPSAYSQPNAFYPMYPPFGGYPSCLSPMPYAYGGGYQPQAPFARQQYPSILGMRGGAQQQNKQQSQRNKQQSQRNQQQGQQNQQKKSADLPRDPRLGHAERVGNDHATQRELSPPKLRLVVPKTPTAAMKRQANTDNRRDQRETDTANASSSSSSHNSLPARGPRRRHSSSSSSDDDSESERD